MANTSEGKQEEILQELKRRAKEEVRHGTMSVEFKIHEGIIIGGEIVGQKIKLG